MRPLLRNTFEIEVLGLHLTVRRIIGLAVLVCIIVLLGYTISGLGGDDGEGPVPDNTTGRYKEESPNWPLCAVFFFLGMVLVAFLVVEIGS